MPKKSVREMTMLERMLYSLSSRVFRAVLLGTVLLGAVCLMIGLSLYTIAVARQNISTAFNLSRNASAILRKTADTETLSREVMTRYRSLSQEERADPSSEAYRAVFADLTGREDYKTILSVLTDFKESSNVYDIYLAMYDSTTDAMVYIADPDPKDPYEPGAWESVEHNGIKKFLNWDGTGMLYDIGNTENYGWMCTSGVPVKARSGETTCFVLADITLENVASDIWLFVLQYTVGLVAVIILFGFLLIQHMNKTVVKPINRITDASKNYAADKRAGVQNTDHFANLDIHTGDEIEDLSLTVKDMERDLQDYEQNLTKITAEKQRISTELALANKIQADMLPNIFSAFPDHDEFDIYASMTPAKEVGGDFYDFFLIDDDHLALVMADVSGKGVPAALFMAYAKTLIKNRAQVGGGPAEILDYVNEKLCEGNRLQYFVTVWLAIIELSTGKGMAANAGHEHPALRRADGNFELVLYRHSPGVAMFDGMHFAEHPFALHPGDTLFVYTDGVAEATDNRNVLFDTDRMLEALNRDPGADPETLVRTVRHAIDRFVGDAPQFDDITMLALRYNGALDSAKELTVDAVRENFDRVYDFLDSFLNGFDCSPENKNQVRIAVEELFVNIASYAYSPETGTVTVRVKTETAPPSVTVTFVDAGVPFDPLKKQDPDIALSPLERQIGGLGIFMVKKMMDETAYEYRDGKNVMTIKKILK